MSRIIPLRPELVALTEDVVSALILQQLCYWTSRTELDGRWVAKSAVDLAEELGNGVSARTVRRRLQEMDEGGFIESRATRCDDRQPNNKDWRVKLQNEAISHAIEQSKPVGQNDRHPPQKAVQPSDKMTDASDNLSEPPSEGRPAVGQNDRRVGQSVRPPYRENIQRERDLSAHAHAQGEPTADESGERDKETLDGESKLPASDRADVWAELYGLEPIDEHDRMDIWEFQRLFRRKTKIKLMWGDERISADVRGAVRYFAKDVLQNYIAKAGEPGVIRPYGYLMRCLKEHAAGHNQRTAVGSGGSGDSRPGRLRVEGSSYMQSEEAQRFLNDYEEM